MAYLVYNELAAEFQDNGLNNYSLRENQEGARANYNTALTILDLDTSIDHDSTDYAAQLGAIQRNLGFTYVRDGVASGVEADFQLGFDTLRKAVATTAIYAGGAREPFFLLDGPEAAKQTRERAERELLSEHAASLGLLARAATIAEVVLGTSTEETQTLKNNYASAHALARLGANGYYRVSNAMNGARDERIAGDKIHAGIWIARAVFGVAWAAKSDRSNLGSSAKTFFGRLGSLRTQRAARKSIYTRP